MRVSSSCTFFTLCAPHLSDLSLYLSNLFSLHSLQTAPWRERNVLKGPLLQAVFNDGFCRQLPGLAESGPSHETLVAGAICEWVGENDTHKCTRSQFAAEGIDCNISNSKQGRQFLKLPPGGNLHWSKKVSFEGILSPIKTRAVKYQPDKQGRRASLLKSRRFL